MINKTVLVGRLTKTPELKISPQGKAICRFTLAVNRTFTNQQGDREADFISCVAFGKTAENLVNFMDKGALIGVDGRIQTGKYQGQDGKDVYTTDVIAENIQFLEKRTGGAQQGQNQQQQNYGGNQQQNPSTNQPQYNQPNQNSYGQGQQSNPQYNQPNQQQQQNNQYGNQPPQNYGNGNGTFNTSAPNDSYGNPQYQQSNNGGIEVSEDDLPF